MPTNDVISEKKKALIAYKEKILQDIKYYDKRIDDVRAQASMNSFFEEANSSDSEVDFSLTLDYDPSLSELKQQQAMLRTCLQATQELTSLQVLQSEVNVLVDDPEYVGERPVTEPGTWREVTAECRVDLVPFTITFYVHQPDRKFGAWSYRGLRVVPVKPAHEGELSKSVLPTLSTPSDAIEVVKSYAHAQRSRRSSLARLADKFANTLYMEPMSDGGYVLKCANLLEMSWTLQNKWSPIAPFHHRMKFDLEYMDESYIKTITQVHRQLSDPSIDTDERTLLLAKIISTCLEAQGPTQELYESMSSDQEAASLRQRRTTLDREPDHPARTHRQTDSEVMAPPRSLPKKAKPKGKENMVDNRKEKLKRGNSNEEMNRNKKLKPDTETNPANKENTEKRIANTEEQENATNQEKPVQSNKTSVASIKTNDAKKVANKNNPEASNKVDKANNVASEKNNAEVTGKSAEKNKLTKKKSDLAKDAGKKTEDLNKKANKTETVKEKSDRRSNNVANTKNIPKTVDSDKNANKAKMVKEKSNEKLKNAASVKSKATEDNQNVKETVNDEKGEKVKATSTKESKPEDSDANINKKPVDSVKSKKSTNIRGNINDQIKENQNSKNAEVKANVNTQGREKQGSTVKEGTKKAISINNKQKDARITKISDKKTINSKPITKPKDLIGNTNKISNKETKESTKSKDFEKNHANTEKRLKDIPNSADKVKKVASAKNYVEKQNPATVIGKKLPEPKKDVNNKMTVTKTAEKNKLQEKTKTITKKDDLQKKLTKNDKQANNIENTLEKVVEKSVAVKRKSNVLDIDNAASEKKSNNTVAGEKINKNVPVKRKSNYVDNNVASAKKRALSNLESVKKPIENAQMKRTNTDIKIRSDNFQKAIKNKTEKNFKTKLTPGSIKTKSIPGNTKVLSASNIGSDKKISKIPQKKLSSVPEAMSKKNPLRISPRKIPSKFKTVEVPRSIQKTTSIPRLLKKPVPKT